jgi:transcription elongation GreA/GreB family factor
MQAESLVQLIGSGNTSTVEEEWSRLLQSPEATPAALLQYQPVLAALCKQGKTSVAEEWAWNAIESQSTRLSPLETLEFASAYLLAIGDSNDLRQQVCEFYRAAHGDREGLEALLTEAGLAGGRPVRRALRTLEVCLTLSAGDALAARDGESAAKVTRVDRKGWRITLDAGSGSETLGAVELADRFRRAAPDDFAVLRFLDPDRLADRLESDPAGIIVELCKAKGGTMSSLDLEAVLVPDVLPAARFKSWFTKARTAIKKRADLSMDGRSPYTFTYAEVPLAHGEILLAEFQKLRDPADRLERFDKYLRECKDRNEVPSKPSLRGCFDAAARQAREFSSKESPRAGLAWAIAGHIGDACGADHPWSGLRDLLRTSADPGVPMSRITDDALFDRAVGALGEAHPGEWRELLLDMLPGLVANTCDRAACHLVDGGWDVSEFDALLQRILSAPAANFEAMLWLWDGPSKEELDERVNLLTMLTRIMRTLDDARRGQGIPKEQAKAISARARTVLGARRYERFLRLLGTLDPGMASPLKTQIAILDNLGRAVPEDMIDHLKLKFPTKEVVVQTPPWKREDVLYVTREALTRRQEEVEYHVNVKMKENAQAIGAAAALGDLSENSEYKFALEERDLLRARLGQMNSELAMAQVITAGEVSTAQIGIGTRVLFIHVGTGQRLEMTFMGPWDADPTKGWINYKAPLSQTLMGKKAGDEVPFEHDGASGTFKVSEIHNALV